MTNDMIQTTSEAMANRAAVDPLLTLVRAYCEERDRINADESADDEHFHWLLDRLTHDTLECWTAEGAAEALQLVAGNIQHDICDMHGAVLASVMTFVAHRT